MKTRPSKARLKAGRLILKPSWLILKPGRRQSEEDHNHSHGDDGHDHTHAEGPPPMDPACKREISVEIPADVVAKQQEALVQQYSKQARIPGFRKGKVPASMVRNRFSSEITSDVVEHLVPQYFREAVIKGGFRPVSQPHIYGLEFTPGEPIKFKAAFEVLPEFDLGDYKAIKVEKPEIAVTDAEIDAEIAKVQEQQASFDPVNDDRGAENGEFVQVSFEARPKGLADDEPEALKPRVLKQKPLKQKTRRQRHESRGRRGP